MSCDGDDDDDDDDDDDGQRCNKSHQPAACSTKARRDSKWYECVSGYGSAKGARLRKERWGDVYEMLPPFRLGKQRTRLAYHVLFFPGAVSSLPGPDTTKRNGDGLVTNPRTALVSGRLSFSLDSLWNLLGIFVATGTHALLIEAQDMEWRMN
jgi:hypothetical protein